MNGRILVCDPIAEDGVALLKQLGAAVDVRTGLSREELLQAVDGYDALIVNPPRRGLEPELRRALARARAHRGIRPVA